MQESTRRFDELEFFAKVKKKPGLFFGRSSFRSFCDMQAGMEYAFFICDLEHQFKYFHLFIDWYQETIVKVKTGYASWSNHILYTSGNRDDLALDSFFRWFERYLRDVHNLCLPEVE